MSLSPLVRLIPVLSSTASFTLTLTEYQSLLPWLTLSSHPTSVDSHLLSKHLSNWFDRWFRLGLVGVLALGITSTWGGYAAWRGTFGTARVLYKYGTCFALGHFAFALPIARCITRLVHGPTKSKDELRLWLRIHTIRTLTTDVPALLCFVGAFLHTVA